MSQFGAEQFGKWLVVELAAAGLGQARKIPKIPATIFKKADFDVAA